MALKQEFIEDTLRFWETRYSNRLTQEDARQIKANFTDYFNILSEWNANDCEGDFVGSNQRRC